MSLGSEKIVNVIQGNFEISDSAEVVLTTVLGSCVAMCLIDPTRKIGGMNHFLLPGDENSKTSDVRYGVYAMELLINGLLRQGADKSKMQAKLFGGANMMSNLRDIGSSNATFARRFLKDEGIPCIGESLGGRSARRIRFWPTTGRVQQMVVNTDHDPVVPVPKAPPKPKVDDIVLF